jgi:hypothetical protein
MISDEELRQLAELYDASADADISQVLDTAAEQRRKAFDLEVERLFAREPAGSIQFHKFKNRAVKLCVKYLHRDLPPDERRARDTTR